MSQPLSSDSQPSKSPRGARWYIVIAIAALLGSWMISVVVQNSMAIAALARSDKQAKEALRQYVDALCAGDLRAATLAAHSSTPKDDIQGLTSLMPRFGAVTKLSFTVVKYFDDPQKTMYYMEAPARFEHGGTKFIARIWKVGDQWKVHDLSLTSVPPGVKTDDDGELLPGALSTQPSAPLVQRPPEMSIDVHKHYQAVIETSRGNIALDLFPKEAPITVNNFVHLARKKFYDGLSFHRVIDNFMIQAGDPTASGDGGPGYCFGDETDPHTNPHLFQTGTLAMANAGPDTNGSQFFITHKPTPWLQGKHTIFGQVHDPKSQEVVNQIHQGDLVKTIRIEESKPGN